MQRHQLVHEFEGTLAATMISVTLNGKPRTFDANLSITDLLSQLEINPRLVAVAINGEVVPKKLFATTRVHDGDTVEIVRMVGGGAATLLG